MKKNVYWRDGEEEKGAWCVYFERKKEREEVNERKNQQKATKKKRKIKRKDHFQNAFFAD